MNCCIIFTAIHRGDGVYRIKELREAFGWTQEYLAEFLDVEKITISRYERGERQPDLARVCSLCDLFGCTSDYLLGRSDAQLPEVTPDQAAVLRAYDRLPLEIRKAVDGLLAPYMVPEKKKETA